MPIAARSPSRIARPSHRLALLIATFMGVTGAVALAPKTAHAANVTSLSQGATLTAGNTLSSPTGKFQLSLAADGEIAIYPTTGSTTTAVWSNGVGLSTASNKSYSLTLDTSTCELREYQKTVNTMTLPGTTKKTTFNTTTLSWSANPSIVPAEGCFAAIDDTTGALTINKGTAPTSQLIMYTTASEVTPEAVCTKVFTFQPAGTDNAITFHVSPAAVTTTATGYSISNTYVYLPVEGGIKIPMMVTSGTFKGSSQSSLTAVELYVQKLPIPSLPGALEDMESFLNDQPIYVSASSGSDYNANFPQLPLYGTRNYVSFQTITGRSLPDKIPSFKFGETTLNTKAQDTLNGQIQFLLDPTSPGFFFYGGMLGQTMMTKLQAIGIGVSAKNFIPWTPTTTSDLPANTIPSFSGNVYLGGAVYIQKYQTSIYGGMNVNMGSLTKPTTPIQFGANAKFCYEVPIISSFVELWLDYANATVYSSYTNDKNWALAFDAIGDTAGLLPKGMPAKILPAKGTMNAYGNVAMVNGVYSDSSTVGAKATYSTGVSGLTSYIANGPALADIDVSGTFTASKAGVILQGTTSNSPLSSIGLEGPMTVDAFFGPDGKTFDVGATGGINYGGVDLVDASIDISNTKGVTVKGKVDVKYASLEITGVVTKSGGTLTGTAAFEIPISQKAGKVIMTGVDATVCATEAVTDSTVCGVETVTNGAKCGYDVVTDATKCGANYMASGAVCGWDWVTDAAACGSDTFTGAVKCGTKCLTSGFSKCKCSKPKSCNKAKSCDVPRKCPIDKTCSVGKSCSGVSSCTWDVDIAQNLAGSIKGNITASVGTGGASFTGSLKYCATGSSSCTGVSSTIRYKDKRLQVCASGIPGVSSGSYCVKI